jgi:alkylation response protein AidB-like acyl-CoA dehydrogenase
MRANGYLRLAVPEDLGGLGASIRQACYAQAELSRAFHPLTPEATLAYAGKPALGDSGVTE